MAYNYLGSPRTAETGTAMAFYVIDIAGGSNIVYDVDWGDSTVHDTGSGVPYAFLSHVYAAVGTYTITLVTDVGGTEHATVTVTPPSAHLDTVYFDEGPPLFSDTTIHLNAYSDYELTHINVDWGDSTAHFTDDQNPGYFTGVPHVYATAGDYTMSITVSNSRGTLTRTFPLSIVTPPPGADPSHPIVLTGASGSYTIEDMGAYPDPSSGAPRLSYTSEMLETTGDHGAWFSWTAPKKGVLVIHAACADSSDQVALETVLVRTSDDKYLRTGSAQPNHWDPENECEMGTPVMAGKTYLLLVVNSYGSSDITFDWHYQQRSVGGEVLTLQYGADNSVLLEAVSLTDPEHYEVIAWQGLGAYHNTGDLNAHGRYLISPDRHTGGYDDQAFGETVIENGEWAQPIPSIYESDSALYLGRVDGDFNYYRGQGATYVPGGQDFAFIQTRNDGPGGLSHNYLYLVPPTGARREYRVNGAVYPTSDVGPIFVREHEGQHADFFEADGSWWVIGYCRTMAWSSGLGRYAYTGGSNAIVRICHYALNDTAMTADLIEEFDPFTGYTDPNHYIRPFAIAQVGSKLLVSYLPRNPDGSGGPYEVGIWIRVFDIATLTLLDTFEYRPWPVLPAPSTGSEPGHGFWSFLFFTQGYMVADPTDDGYFFMTNESIGDDGKQSLVFRIPVVDPGPLSPVTFHDAFTQAEGSALGPGWQGERDRFHVTATNSVQLIEAYTDPATPARITWHDIGAGRYDATAVLTNGDASTSVGLVFGTKADLSTLYFLGVTGCWFYGDGPFAVPTETVGSWSISLGDTVTLRMRFDGFRLKCWVDDVLKVDVPRNELFFEPRVGFLQRNDGTEVSIASEVTEFTVTSIPYGGSRYEAMRTPWHSHSHPSNGEIYLPRAGVLPLGGGGWSVGRVN